MNYETSTVAEYLGQYYNNDVPDLIWSILNRLQREMAGHGGYAIRTTWNEAHGRLIVIKNPE